MRKIFFLAGGIIGVVFFGLFVYADTVYRDPFMSLLPVPKTENVSSDIIPSDVTVTPPALNVQGLLWGTDKPMAIINGEVYREGDTMDSTPVKIYKIEKEKISIIYQGRTFEVSMEK